MGVSAQMSILSQTKNLRQEEILGGAPVEGKQIRIRGVLIPPFLVFH